MSEEREKGTFLIEENKLAELMNSLMEWGQANELSPQECAIILKMTGDQKLHYEI